MTPVPSTGAALITLFEKAFSTWLEVAITLVLVRQGADLTVSFLTISAVAAIPAGLTVIANGLPGVPLGLPWAADMVLRTIRTYAVTFIGLLVAVPVFSLDLSNAKVAALGAIPAALAVIKAALASKVGNTNSAALVPARFDLAA